jgi:Transposase DDE domain/Domain of unknown function (DUF4372)
MSKSKYFSGQPVLSQLLGLIPDKIIFPLVHQHQSDRYYKTFKTRDHLISMLYACFHNCTSLRELTTGLAASYNKLSHLNMHYLPRRSTLSDANAKRPEAVFAQLYSRLYELYYKVLPDSRQSRRKEDRLFIMDSTTVSLFSDIMKGAGSYAADGRKKGGVKAHVLLDAHNGVPSVIYLSEGARNDRIFMNHVSLNKGDILVFDKGYHHFAKWQQWTNQGISWVTRLIGNEVYQILQEKPVSYTQQLKGVCQDRKIFLGRGSGPGTEQITVRLISYYVPEHKKVYHFLTNNFKFRASTIADIYHRRWQVELFFKRIKQTNPIKYFLGNNENAIRIQLWCAFIKDLLVKIVKDQIQKRWSFANIAAMIRHHLMNYINLFGFLNNPEKFSRMAALNNATQHQLSLYDT